MQLPFFSQTRDILQFTIDGNKEYISTYLLLLDNLETHNNYCSNLQTYHNLINSKKLNKI